MNKTTAILAAVSEEIAGIKQAMNISDRIRLGKSEAWPGKWQGKNIVLVRTGVGKQRAAEAALKTIEQFSPDRLLSIGYAGGLVPNLEVSDLIVAEQIMDVESSAEFVPDPQWLQMAQNVSASENYKVISGRLVTADKVIHSPQDKKEFGERFSAEAVEMETSAIAKVAMDKNMPFLSVRAISDSVEQEILDSSSFLGSDGEISKLKAGWYVLTHPGSISSALSLRSQTQRATRTMTEFVSNLL
jgi:adenosylhomocysteine nucleosidase